MPALKSDSLQNRTARSAVFVVRESLKSLRQYSADLSDPSNIDRVIKTAEVLSTSLKKLEPFLDAPAKAKVNRREGEMIDLPAISRVLSAVLDGRICAACSGIIPAPEEAAPDITVRAPAPARKRARDQATANEEHTGHA